MNNWHSIALTGSSPPWSTRRLDIERTSTLFTLLRVEVIVVQASLALLSVQPRRASKEIKTKLELAHFTKLDSAIDQKSSVEPDDHYPLTCTPGNGVWMLRIWIPAVFCLCLEAKRRARILWCSMKVRSPWAWSAGAGRAHRRTEHYIINPFFFFLLPIVIFTSYYIVTSATVQ